MADAQGYLSAADVQKAKDWIDRHRRTANCPVCGNSRWQMNTLLVTPVAVSSGPAGYGTLLGGNIFPQVMITCLTCAHTQYFMAIAMGLLPDAKTAPDNPHTGE